MFALIKEGSLREGAGAAAPEGERERMEALQGREIHIVVAPKVWRAVSKTKTNSLVARAPPAAYGATPLPEGGFRT